MQKKLKMHIIAITLIQMMIFSSCSNPNVLESGSEPPSTNQDVATPETVTDYSASTDTEQTTEATSPPIADAQFTIPDIPLDVFDIPDTEGLAFVKDMRIGWNLGNTFDAGDITWLNDELDYESAWCGEKTTQQMFDDIKAAGFNSIRIPVTWHNHVDLETLTINPAWLNRVTEVVDYAMNNDMYAIINIHHDFNQAYIYPTSDYYDNSSTYMTAIWTQLAENFKDYDQKLIFESMNEPRMVGHNNEWWIDNNNQDCIDAIESVNRLNQVFLDVVRASGGNNSERYLMIPGYDASADGALHANFQMPVDTVSDRLIVSVHAYTPYDFALKSASESGSTSEFDPTTLSSTMQITQFMDGLYNKFISQGIPVVIGEFGARDKSLNHQAKVNYATFYVAQAKARGMTCYWWDNNAFSGAGELFGLYNRSTNLWPYPEIVAGMMKYLNLHE